MFVLENGIGNYIKLKNKRYSYFAGNNYLGLANHPALKKEAISSIDKYGISFSASRNTTGTSELHLELEKLLSEFKNKNDSVVFASGYMGNKILLHALQDQYSALFIDESAHPSIPDGIPPDISNVYFYDHCNSEHLERLLKKKNKQRPLIITDGLFALTGEIAPLDKIYPLAKKYNAILIVDDAHATGILGENGRGTPEHFQLDGAENIYQSETMSKALGTYGGFISATKNIITKIRDKSSVYIGSTSLPPPVVSAGCSAIKILKQHPELRSGLFENASYIRKEIQKMGFLTTPDNTPIIPLFFNSRENAIKLSEFLEENYFIVPYIKYPVKMDKFLVRLTASTTHTKDQIERLLELLKKWRNRGDSGMLKVESL